MEEWREHMWLDREEPVGRLHLASAAYPAAFLGELDLTLAIAHMLDDTVAVYNVEGMPSEREVLPVAYHPARLSGLTPRCFQVEEDQPRPRGDELPIEGCTAEIQGACVIRQSKRTFQPKHPS